MLDIPLLPSSGRRILFLKKYKTATTSILHGNENCNGFIYYQSISCLMICSNNEFVKNRLLVSGGNAPSVPQVTSFYGVYNKLPLSSKLFGVKENISNRAEEIVNAEIIFA